ncbi:hypothetical protein ACH49_26970 [Streptomyces leeuwenhoekii]|uniref:Uncharacterized protein n=1 Tax=Streptomyces leeuwenhoekii TaxID=1437453 RepID=A0ABR5HSD8_STRLW|nr:hypothetical protein [Streptomyces leeuwenhoekii]KMS68717.1 hypothetical protein ACH49_26970 [Streptomyces leeuwenhoekii]
MPRVIATSTAYTVSESTTMSAGLMRSTSASSARYFSVSTVTSRTSRMTATQFFHFDCVVADRYASSSHRVGFSPRACGPSGT